MALQDQTVQVNIDELRNSKDQVLMRLMALQSYIADLSKAYVEHVNSVINGGPATIDIPALPVGLSVAHFERAASPAAKSDAGGPKKRKRAPVDPNAPKRPLTPYFLYMANNRSIIAGELPGDAKPKDVSDEGTRRWTEMPAQQKEVWKLLYADNYEKYKRDVEAYKAGRKVTTGDDEDAAATQLQQDFAEAEEKSDESEAEEEVEPEAQEESAEESSSPSPPPKEKTPRAKRRRSDSKATKEVPDSAAKQSSPVKKLARGRKAPEPVKETPVSESKKGKNKKRKSEV
ncbi:hypothetical protein N7488_011001 [Penicillium malachiteum]|nr:hypothetical protein N7488_011001 [Penicillium malachiteum]